MTLKQIISFIIIFFLHLGYSQNSNTELIKYIQNADKILLVSHESFNFNEYEDQDENNRKKLNELKELKKLNENNDTENLKKSRKIYLELEEMIKAKNSLNRSLLENGKPNKRIIREETFLNEITKKELLEIISKQKRDTFEGAFCFNPHHTIFIFSQEKWSYIDICFGCNNYSFSNDLNIDKKDFLATLEDWKTLENFFRKLNLNYLLPKQRQQTN